MRKTKIINAKAADLTVFYDEHDPQQYLVYSLKFGETVIGGSPDKSQLVLHFTSELDDAHAKITVEDEDYSIEDLGSHKGTFKIKSDNSLIRLKPFKSYDLAPQTAFYLGRFKCIFRAAKTGRNDGLFSLSPLDGHSQRGKDNGVKRQVSYDDIEEDELFKKSKKGILQKLSKNQKESEHIEEEEEHKVPASRVLLNKAVGQIVSKKEVQSQKHFVKSKGQLPKVEKNKDEESVSLNQSFLKRIQEKLLNSQISKQKDLINEMGAKYSSQSQKSQKKNQDLKSQVKEIEKEDNEEDEEVWKPLKIKDSKKGSEKVEEKKRNNKEAKVEEKKQTKIDKIIEDIMSTNLGQKIAKIKEQKARQQEEKKQNKAKPDGKVDEKGTELNGGANGKGKKSNRQNQRTPDKSTINEKIQKILSNFVSEKKDEEKEEIPVKEAKGKVITNQGKKDEKEAYQKKKEVSQKAVQNEIKEQKGKPKKEQKIVEEKEEEEEMIFEKKSAVAQNGKKNAPKSEINGDMPRKSARNQKPEEGAAKEDSPKKIISKRKAGSGDESSKQDGVLLGKRKAARKEIEIIEELPKKKVKGADEKEQNGKVKPANTPKKDKSNGKSSSAAKKELAQLLSDGSVIQEGARRGKLRVVFSNSCVDDLEREKLRLLGVKVVEDFESTSEFDLLVTDEIVRRLKILVAINKAIPIVSSEWVKEAIKQQTIIPFEPFIISKASKALSKQYSFDLSSSIIRQFEHPEGVLAGVAFSLPYPLDNISTQELRKLLLSAGATFSSSSNEADTYTITEASKKEQNEELLKLGVKLVSQEGILQSCLLQINVLDDYLIKKTAAASSKKKANKK